MTLRLKVSSLKVT